MLDPQVNNALNATNVPTSAVISANCPTCHVAIRTTDYFCFNCGQALKVKPIEISVVSQILYYLGSLALPPLGIIWGIRLLSKTGPNTKFVGTLCIVLTILSIAISLYISIQLINQINEAVFEQTNILLGF